MLQIIYTMSSSDQILIPSVLKKFTPQIFQLYRFLKEQFSTYDASQNPSPSIIRHAKLLRNWEGKVTSICNRIILLYYTGVIPLLHGFFLTFWSQKISRMRKKKWQGRHHCYFYLIFHHCPSLHDFIMILLRK